jgi:hypothetical protein
MGGVEEPRFLNNTKKTALIMIPTTRASTGYPGIPPPPVV